MIDVAEKLKPELATPFPNIPEFWKCNKTGLIVPKHELANINYRTEILRDAEYDKGFQNDLMAASRESLLFWINTFCWTFHQFDVAGDTGERHEAKAVHCPFISWEIQDILFERLIWHLATVLLIIRISAASRVAERINRPCFTLANSSNKAISRLSPDAACSVVDSPSMQPPVNTLNKCILVRYF